MDIINVFDKLINEYYDPTWNNSKYQAVKYMSTTNKGKLGCNLLIAVLKDIGVKADKPNGDLGEYDVITSCSKRFEVKTATIDVHGSFQFNGLRKDYDYDYAFLLGVAKKIIYYKLYKKEDLVAELTTLMSKKTKLKSGDEGYKKTIKFENMDNIETMSEKIKCLFNHP